MGKRKMANMKEKLMAQRQMEMVFGKEKSVRE